MTYLVTITVEVPADGIVAAVKAAGRCADAIDEAYDDYEVVNLEFKKKPEIPAGFHPHKDTGTIRTWNPPGEVIGNG